MVEKSHLQSARQDAENSIPEAERCLDWDARWRRFDAVLGSLDVAVYLDRDEATGLVRPRVGEIAMNGMELKLDRLLGKNPGKRV